MIPPAWSSAAGFRSFLDGLGNEVAGLRYDLSTAAAVIPRLHPARLAPAILVAGTNGKGSVAWWLGRALQESGYRVGLYTSPHLLDLRERIRLDGLPIDEAALLLHANAARDVVAALEAELPRPPTWYEWLTFVAASFFAAAAPDLHVLEVGLGGRLDAVNVADPVLSVITSIGLDHCRLLGDTVPAIAREKMGILRPAAPVVLGPQDEWARALEADLAAGSAGIVRARDVYTREFAGEAGAPEWELGLPGRFQRFNAATVVACGRTLRRLGWRVSEAALAAALRDGGWPGRMQRLSAEPLIVLDGAHNPAAMDLVAEELAGLPSPAVAVFGAMRDKDWPAMLARLRRVVRTLVLTRVPSERSAGAAEFAAAVDGDTVRYVEDPGDALDAAIALAAGRAPVYVLGSLYLVAAVQKIWQERGTRHP